MTKYLDYSGLSYFKTKFLSNIVDYFEPKTWAQIQKVVQDGLGAEKFPVGSQFTTTKDGTTYTWDVVEHCKLVNNILNPSSTSGGNHAMVLLMHEFIPSIQFDASEAMYYCESALPIGTYNFTLPSGYDVSHGGGLTYQFTTTVEIPAGGQVFLIWNYNQNPSGVKTFANNSTPTALETLSIEEGTDGTALGTLFYRNNLGSTSNLNEVERCRYGSNNYPQSGIRQFINSSAALGEWWQPSNRFDRTHAQAASKAGFLTTLPDDFLSVVKQIKVQTRDNNVFELSPVPSNHVYETEDKFFLASRKNIFGASGEDLSAITEPQFSYYVNATDPDRVKTNRDTHAAGYWWLRSPSVGGALGARGVLATGALDAYRAFTTIGCAPACVIA